MPGDKELVSIIIRTKDRPHLLREALKSLAEQSYPWIEAIVVNDGGEDVSFVVEEFGPNLYQLVYVQHERNRGRAAAANTGLKIATGEWVGLLDDDDLLLPHALETLLSFSKAAQAIYGQVEFVHYRRPDQVEKALFGQPFSRERLFVCNYIPTCGFIFKRSLAQKVGGFDEEFSFLEDWDFFYRLAQETSFVYVPQKVALYRVFGEGYLTSRNFLEEAPWRERFYRKHLPTVTPSLLTKGFFDFLTEQEKTYARLNEEIHRLSRENRSLTHRLKTQIRALEGEKKRLESRVLELEERLAEVFSSRSWRLTEPLRRLGLWLRRSRGKAALIPKFWSYAREHGLRKALGKSLYRLTGRKLGIPSPALPRLSAEEARRIWKEWPYQPKISVIMPVYNPPALFLREALESVAQQFYENWELCVADDASTAPYVREILEAFRQRYPDRVKIVYRDQNGHIAEASNTALQLATGEFVALLDHDDLLAPEALFEVVRLLNQHPEADLIYSDEDKILPSGKRVDPYFKPDWSPEFFLGQMYTCHLSVFRRRLIEEIGGFRPGFEGAQDWDLVLRFTEKTNRIFHLPKILYHWRIHPRSTAQSSAAKDYAAQAGKRAVEEALKRRQEEAYVEVIAPGRHLVHFIPQEKKLISIIIPTRDLAQDLDRCLVSLYEKTSYQPYEIVIVDNGSMEEETFRVFEKWQALLPAFRVERLDIPFNFSRLVNFGVSRAQGDLILLLNNDTELIGPPHWLQEMAGYALRPEIGCVGAVLLYPDQTIQHAGIILGLTPDPYTPGVAGHAFKYLPHDHPGYFDRLRVVSNYAAVTGACLLVRRSLWEEVEGFDVGLAVAFNDVDFCLKLLSKGYRHVVLPHVRLYHYESKSRGYEDSPEKKKRFEKEIKIMRSRWAHLLDHDPYYNPNLPKHREDFGLGG